MVYVVEAIRGVHLSVVLSFHLFAGGSFGLNPGGPDKGAHRIG